MIGSDEYQRKSQVASGSRTPDELTDIEYIRRYMVSETQAMKARVIDIVRPHSGTKHQSAGSSKKPTSIRRIIQ